MRNSELSSGIDVCDKDGHVIGASKVAAKQVQTTAANIYSPNTKLWVPVPVTVF